MRVASSLALVAILAGSISLSSCGDDAPSSGAAPDARTLLRDTFSPTNGTSIKSATVELSVSGKLAGSTSGKGSGTVKVSVDKASEKGKLPDFRAELTANGSSEGKDLDLDAGATYSGGRFYLSYDGQDYDAGEQLSKQIAEAASQSLGTTPQGGQLPTARLGLEPGTWLKAPKIDGTEQIGGVDAYRITGDVDLKTMVPDILDAARKAQSVAGAAGAGQQVPTVTDAQLESAAKQVKQLDLTIWTGKEDRILRQLKVQLSLDGDKKGDNLSGTIQLTLTAVNEEQKISAPSSTKPLTELPQLGALLGAAGGLSSGAASSGAQGASGDQSSDSGSAEAAAAYAACVSQAGTDPAKLNACERLIAP